MTKKLSKLKVAILSLLALILFATASAFIGVNYGKNLTASAFKKETGTGYIVIEDSTMQDGYFNIDKEGNDLVFKGLSEKTYKLLGVSPQVAGAIPESMPIKVIVPTGVTIMNGSFGGCEALKELVIPEGVTKISDSGTGFYNTGLKKLHIPSTLTSIDFIGFRNNHLEYISVADGNSVYTTDAGYDKDGTCLISTDEVSADAKTLYLATSKITKIPETVATIGGYSFSNKAIVGTAGTLKIPASVSTMNGITFVLSGLSGLDLSENSNFEDVEDSGCIAKTGGTQLIVAFGEKVTVPTKLKTFDNESLSTGSIKEVTLHSNITSFSTNTMRAPYLEKIEIDGGSFTTSAKSNGITTYSKYTVDDYGNLIRQQSTSQADIDEQPKALVSGIIYKKDGKDETKIGNDIVTIADRSYFWREVKIVNVPESVTTIGDYAWDLAGVEVFNIHPNVTSIGNNIVGVTPYYFNDANYDNGNTFYLGTYLMSVKQPIQSSEYQIREGTTVISAGALGSQPNITKLYIPNSVVSIGGSAFGGCSNLTTVYIHSESELSALADGVESQLQIVADSAFPQGVVIVVDDKATYDALTGDEGALSSDTLKGKTGFEVDVTFTVAGQTVKTKLLAGQSFDYSYDQATREWKNTGFSVEGVSVEWLKDDGKSENAFEVSKAGTVPTDVESLSYTAYKNETEVLDEITSIKQPTLKDVQIQYGETYVLPSDFNPQYMQVHYTGETASGVPYDSGEMPADVGMYTVSITPNAGYTWTSGSVAALTASLTITVKTISELIWVVDGIEGNLEHIYDGSQPEVFVFVEIDGERYAVDVVITYENDEWNVGDYALTATFPEGSNYRFESGTNEETLTISPRELSIEWIGLTDFTWIEDEETHNPTFTLIAEAAGMTDLIKFEWYITKKGDGNRIADGAKEAGEYVMYVQLTANGNFVFADGTYLSTQEFKIIEALTIRIYWENIYNGVWDNKAHDPVAYYTVGNSGEKHYFDEITLMFGEAYDTSVEHAINAGKYQATVVLPLEYQSLPPEQIGGDQSVTFEIKKLATTIGWLNANATFAYDGKSHMPYAYYLRNGMKVILEVEYTSGGSTVTEAIDEGNYLATITDAVLANLEYSGNTTFSYSIEKQQTTVTITTWTGNQNYIYNGEAQAPVAKLVDGEGNEVEATSVSVYMTAAGTVLDGAPVNVGSYKVTTSFYNAKGSLIAETSMDFYVNPMKVAKPTVTISVFATMAEAKAYAPSNYAAEYMVYSGEEGDGVYVMTISLRNDNYEWLDGTTDAESYTLKISPDLSATVVGPDGVTYLTVATEAMSKKTLYIIIGGIAVVALVAMIALIAALSRRKVIVNGSDDDEGFYEDYE